MFLPCKKALLLATGFLFAAVSLINAAQHPSLYFDRSELAALRKEATGAKALQFQRLKHWGDLNLERKPPQDVGTKERLHETFFSYIANYGLLFQLTGSKKYLQAGKRWIEVLLETPTGDGENYHIGVFAASLSHAYDFFYESLEPEFRKALAEKILDILRVARRGAETRWWGGIYTHHDFWIPVAAMGVAGLCLREEYPLADSIAGFARQELSQAIELLGERGYWPEGTADWVYGMVPTFLFFDALKKAGGPDFYEHPWVRAASRCRLQHWLPDDSYMFIGDSYRSGRYGTLGSVSAHLLMRLAARYRDGLAQWLALREAAVDSTTLADQAFHGLAWQFLWYDPTLEPVPPDTLALDQLYPNWDTAVFRAGWDSSSPVLAFAGGHLLGRSGTAAWKAGNRRLPGGLAHTHQNAGSIYLWAEGNFPLCPPGYGGRDGRFHSTVMVNGHGQLFEPDHRPRLDVFESGGARWAMASMELTRAYPEDVDLRKYRRTLVFLKPRTIILLDRLTCGETYIRRYEWLLHTDAAVAEWRSSRDRFASVLREDDTPLLEGRVFPSTRYFFERQSMDHPDGRPRTRCLSVTILGRVPSRVEIAGVLHAPAKGEDTSWLEGVVCRRSDQATSLILPASGSRGSRAVVFTAGDSLNLALEVLDCDFVLVSGLSAQRTYRLVREDSPAHRGRKIVPDTEGAYKSSAAGNLVIEK